MNDSVRLGRIAGVRVGVHWSLLITVVLIAGGLAQNRFSIDAPGYSGTAYLAAGVLTALGLLLGVLLHELGHAVVARWRNLAVDGITLGWMGGVTRLEGDTTTPANELLVAGIGPLVSALVGGALLLGRLAALALGAGSLTDAALGWLGAINIALAVFNLLPAAPLDGGKVLHSLVWFIGRDRWRATRVTAGAGMALGGAFVGLGLWMTERGTYNFFDGLLVAFIGWWMFAAARSERGSGALTTALEGVTAAELMRPVAEAPGWVTIRHFVERYSAARPGWVWLLRSWDGSYGGFVAGDAVAAVPYPAWDAVRPADVGVSVHAAVPCAPDEPVLDLMGRTGGRQVVFVVAGGRTVGAVLPADVLAWVRIRSGNRRVMGLASKAAAKPVG
jgi:Zn-dependent protease